MANVPVARRYARALFELGVEKDDLENLGEALAGANSLFAASEDLRIVLANPAVRQHERRAIVQAIAEKAEWPRLFQNFVLLLLDKDRLQHIKAIDEAFRRLQDDHEGRARGSVTSAVPLSDDQLSQIREQLAELTGKTVLLTTAVDEDLIGGVVARVGSTIYDGSISTHLQRLREAILKQV
jgi:F-type H+-transporting ATPase subunit delta